MKNSLLKIILLIFLGGALSVSAKGADKKIKVACIGNSITYGYLLPDPATQSYPSQLQQMLGDGYEVGNFGKSGATLLRHGHRPYFEQEEYKKAIEFAPDIAVIHLGINDTDPRDWPEYGYEFAPDYAALIDSVRASNPNVRILIAQLTPLRATHFRFKSGTRAWLRLIQKEIENVAKKCNVELIDFDSPLRNRQNLLHDGIHPDVEGAGLLAEAVRGAITGNYGDLKLPPVWQSGMVVQRNTPLRLSGTADAGSKITITLDNRKYHAVANNLGQWTITLPPLSTGGPYEMTVTDGKTSISLSDILAGEVWIASGQSNMEFALGRSTGGKEAIANANDSLLRFYQQFPVELTNDYRWSDQGVKATNELNHFRPAVWCNSTPQSATPMSAVAYYFARQLRDSLDCPVGIINNAVGGSNCESWIDVTTLEDNIPEILVDWLSNDYVQKWCQQRALSNLGNDRRTSRHPYEPSYLYSAGIEPLRGFPVAGAIWYQGESNAHNMEVHERLFPLLAESWRKSFTNDSLPILYVQLSSISRPSWPQFRDSQRRMSHSIPRVYMAVSSDYGDSLDVHPMAKLPVGQRLARQALKNVYGFDKIQALGPEPSEAHTVGSELILTTNNSSGMKEAMASRSIIGFEIAEIDGFYYPAKAEIINDNKIKLTNMDVKKPRFVRYGWQPFTRANLINGDSLPASTFSIEATDATSSTEPGLEFGISGAFAFSSPAGVVVAGGCNFPTPTPLAADAKKKFYQGIYLLNPETLSPVRIGSLPQPTAYGAVASTDLGAVLIGGTPNGTPSAQCLLIKVSVDSLVEINSLPSLPVTIDNAYAAAIGHKVYVAGGNANSQPSNMLYCLDLDNLSLGWKSLRSMPGNPRVQPVMAASSLSGSPKLYVWGGFAPRYAKHEPSLELSGLVYDPSKDRWNTLPAPVAPDGQDVSVGGGVACTLSDGTIAIAGGVNKDVFIEALRNQAPDYLQHPIQWYGFNQSVFIFNPSTSSFTVLETAPEAARAGASAVAGENCEFYLIGGELKPRIRTTETLLLKK